MIDSIKIKNFKSFGEAEVSFSNFNVIVGLNAAGKTNLISALYFVRTLVAKGLDTNQTYKNIATLPRELFHRFNTATEFSIEIVLSEREQTFRFGIGVSLLLSEDKLSSSLIISHEKLEKLVGEKFQDVYEREGNKLKDAQGKDIPLDVDPAKVALYSFVNPEAKIAKGMIAKIRMPSEEIMDSRDVIANSSSPVLAGLLIKLKNGTSGEYIQFQKIINKILPSFDSFIDVVVPENPRLNQESKGLQEYFILYQEKNIKDSLSMKAISKGDIRTLFLIAMVISLPPNSSLIIEEIENGIHPKRVSDIISHLDNISRIKNVQIIFTTHSPFVIDSLKPSDVIFVSKDTQEGTELINLKNQKRMAHIQDVLNEGGKLTDYIFSQLG